MNLAVIMPSRGLIFSETIEEVLREVAPLQHSIFFSHSRPIPECFNEPLERVMHIGSYTHVWFVEEDMVLPEGILQELIDMETPIATSDYAAVEGVMCVKRDNEGHVLYTGTGCLLVDIGVFQLIDKPIFNTSYIYTPDGNYIGKRSEKELHDIYGQHDVRFFLQARMLGIPIGVTEGICGQRKIIEYGAKEVNDGFHKVKII